jgi:O-antigen/teichoic acid export membrane protein
VVKGQPKFVTKFDKKYISPLLRSAWPMVLSTLAIIMYMRVDQIMIKNMLGTYELGLYSAGTRIYEGWIMVFVVISTSLLPAIVKLKESASEQYEKRLSQLFSLLFWGAMIGSVFVAIYSEEVIRLVFGQKFIGAETVFMLVMWSAPFAAIGSLTARYLIVEKMERKITLRSVVTLLRSNMIFSQSVLKYFKNSFWMLSEYTLRVVSAIFVTVYVARYIGPESFGILMYAIAIVSVFMAISNFSSRPN